MSALCAGLAWGAGLYAVSWCATWLGTQLGLEHEHGAFRIAWMAGSLLAGAFGEELLLAFLRTGRNLVVPIVAHGVLDVVGLTELFLAS